MPFMTKPDNKLGVEGMYLNIVKDVYDKPTAHIRFIVPLRSGIRQGFPLSALLFNIVL